MIPVALAILPWAAVWLGLDVLRSAPAAFVLYGAACAAGVAVLGLPRRESWRPRLGWRVHALVAVAACGAFMAAYRLLGSRVLPPATFDAGLARAGLSTASLVWLVPCLGAVNPIVEESFWRGGVFRAFRQRLPARHAAFASGCLFAAWHALVVFRFMPAWGGLLALAGILAAGIGLALVHERTASLADVILLHLLGADLPILVVFVLALGRSASHS